MIYIGVLVVVIQQPQPQPEPPPAAPPPAPAAPAVNPLQPVCPACGWSRVYTNLRSARNGFAAHRGHCAGAPRRVSEFLRPFKR